MYRCDIIFVSSKYRSSSIGHIYQDHVNKFTYGHIFKIIFKYSIWILTVSRERCVKCQDWQPTNKTGPINFKVEYHHLLLSSVLRPICMNTSIIWYFLVPFFVTQNIASCDTMNLSRSETIFRNPRYVNTREKEGPIANDVKGTGALICLLH